MGMQGRREAVRSAQIDAGGVTVAFAPLADGSDFTAAGEAMRYDMGDGVELIIHLDGSTVNDIELCEAGLD